MARWTLHEPATGETWEMPFNPNAMTSPHPPDGTSILTRSATRPLHSEERAGAGLVRVGKRQPYEWSFSGVVRTEEHYKSLLRWLRKTNKVELADHLGRTWEIRFVGMDVNEQKPTARRAWRFQYTAKAIIYRQVNP